MTRGARARLPFRAVNRKERPGYDAGLQRHHLLPRQLLSRRCFGPLFAVVGRERVGFDDFRANGMLLPARSDASLRLGLPLHRGPHRRYNEMVIERVGQIEGEWARLRSLAPDAALEQALFRLALLQAALRRRLLDGRSSLVLNRRDPLGQGFDFTALDAMAERLWGGTQAIAAQSPSFAA